MIPKLASTYHWHKHFKKFRRKVLKYCDDCFDAHYKRVMSSSTKRRTKYRATVSKGYKHNLPAPRKYHLKGGRIGNKRYRGFIPYLMIAATYCRATPMYSDENEVHNLRRQTAPQEPVNMNDDYGFDIDELWSENDTEESVVDVTMEASADEAEIYEEMSDEELKLEAELAEHWSYDQFIYHEMYEPVFHVMDEDALGDGEDFLAYSSNIRKFTPAYCQMDTDSYPIGIDSYASRCISPFLEDFEENTLVDLKKDKKVRPFGKGPGLNISKMGTLNWQFQDDCGVVHKFRVHNALYVPTGSMRLLSPQHFAVNALPPDYPWYKEDFTSTQHWNRNVLRWGVNREFKKTVHNSRLSNVPTFYSAPNLSSFRSFIKTEKKKEKKAGEIMTEEVVYEATCDTPDVETPSSTKPILAQGDEDFAPSESAKRVSFDLSDQQFCGFCDPSQAETRDENIQDFMKLQPDESNEIQELLPDEQELVATSRKAEFMRWHHRLGHMEFAKMRRLARLGYLPKWITKIHGQKCKICQFGTQTRTPWRTKGEQKKLKEATKPGECVSVDQMESSTEGFFGQLKGKLTTKRYKYATVFVDHYSRFTFVYNQETLSSEDTVKAKEAFEAKALEYGIKVEHYHADNGRFADNAFRNHVSTCGQTITFCGVNAHWQNGIAEKAIRDLKDTTRTMLLHSIDRWPGALSLYLWPYALKHAAHIRNVSPFRDESSSPLEKFTGSTIQPNMKTMHTFGCPVYVLNKTLQQQQTIPTWLPRSRIGVYLGQSEHHARSVSLVMSLTTGLVSPQFHVQHDDFFESLSKAEAKSENRTWMNLAGLKLAKRTLSRTATLAPKDTYFPLLDPVPVSKSPDNIETVEPPEQQQEDKGFEFYSDPDVVNYGRGHRVRKINNKIRESLEQRRDNIVSYKATSEKDDDEFKREYYNQMHHLEYIEQAEMENPIAYKASTNPDIMYYHQAMKAPDRDKFVEAIIDEVNAHIEGNHWEMVPIEDVPEGTLILDSVWAMRRKRDIKTREVYKHKARLNLHGGQQIKGVHYDETYSPVVQWASVRMALILSIVHGWSSRQIDFVLAFPQADIPHDNYMKLPKGVKTVHGDGNSHVLKIKKNLYGGKNAGKVWFDYLKGALENIGFTQSEADPCVFYRKNVMFMYYVDDGLFFCKDPKAIDQAIEDLRNVKKAKRKLTLDDQGDIKDYLGINFEKSEDGRIKLTQPQIIDDILSELGIDDKWTSKPVAASSSKILSRNADAISPKAPFNYRKVIGKLNFLEKSTRPDIAYAVHQCARFSSDPKQEHYDAVMYLGRYLKGTRSEGVIINPNLTHSFETWADADWAGNWNKETAEYDASTAKSRSGYVILLAGCPIVWASKLQTQVALSSCEAEYICLSQALRETIPLMRMMEELRDREFIEHYSIPTVHCKAFEDNSGCVELAKVHKMRPRTKHINIAYHHFREAVRDGKISIHQVKTEDQIADIFTKPLQQNLFVKFRKLIMNW